MSDCIFCKLVTGEIPTNTVFEDELTFAFLDMHPINPGHTLVIPKTHEPDFYTLDDMTYVAVMATVKRMSKTINEAFTPKRVGIMVMGWDVPHAHVHVVPMNDPSDITSKSILEGTRANPTQAELAAVADTLRNQPRN